MSYRNLTRPAKIAGLAFLALLCLNLLSGSLFPISSVFSAVAYGPVVAVLSMAVLWGWGLPVLSDGWACLRRKTVDLEVLLAFALFLSLIVFGIDCWFGFGRLLDRGYGYSFAVIIAFTGLFRVLRHKLKGFVESGVGFALNGLSCPVSVVAGSDDGSFRADSENRVELGKLISGNTIRLEAGCCVPCDGVVTVGRAVVEERRYSGYSVIKSKSVSSSVYAGSRLISGSILVQVDSTLQDSGLMGFVTEFNRRLSEVAKANTKVESIKTWCECALLLISVVVLTMLLLRQAAVTDAIYAAVSVLLLAPLVAVFDISLLARSLIFSSAFRRGVLLSGVDGMTRLYAARNLVVDYNSGYPPGRPEVIGYELIDRRVDQSALDRLLFTFFSQSDEELHKAATRYLQRKIQLKDFTFPELKDCCIYPSQGFVGTLDGVKLIIGSESFLIRQGVQIQPSDLVEDSGGEVSLYIAVQDAVIARMRFGAVFVADGEVLVENLRKLKIRTVIVSEEPNDKVDTIGRQIGLELSDVHAGLSKLQFEETVGKIADAAFYAQPESDPGLYNGAMATLLVFDPVRFEIEDHEATVFTRDLDVVYQVLRSVKSYWPLLQSYSYYFAALSGLALGVTMSIGMAPALAAGIAILAAVLTWSRLLPLVVKL